MVNSVDILMLLDNDFASDRRVDKEAKTLAAHGFSVMVLALSSEKLLREETRNGYSIHRVLPSDLKRPLRKGTLSLEAELLETLKAYNYRILHCHDYHLLPLAAELKRERPETKLVYDSHEYLAGWPYYREAPNPWLMFKGKVVWHALIRREKKALALVDLLITPSKEIGTRLLKSLPDGNAPLITVRNIPEVNMEEQPSNLRDELKVGPQETLIVHSGNVYHNLRQSISLARSISKLHNCRLLYIGDRPVHRELKQAFELTDYRDNVLFHPYNEQTLHSDLSQCTVGLAITNTRYLAHRIGSSNRVMEYSLAGLPILGTAQTTHHELQRLFGHIVTFNMNESESFEQGLKKLLDNIGSYRSKASIAARALDWSTEFKPVTQTYMKFMEG